MGKILDLHRHFLLSVVHGLMNRAQRIYVGALEKKVGSRNCLQVDVPDQ
jgi:hypothetical protein